MNVTMASIDIAACRATNHEPAHVVERGPQDTWLVATGQVQPGSDVQWARVTQEKHVMVPVIRYITVADPARAVAFAASIGAIVGTSDEVTRGVRRLHVVYGSLVENISGPQGQVPTFGVYLGFALQVG